MVPTQYAWNTVWEQNNCANSYTTKKKVFCTVVVFQNQKGSQQISCSQNKVIKERVVNVGLQG